MKHLIKTVFFLIFAVPTAVMADTLNVTLHYVGPTEGQAWMGVNQGIDEANRQGRFLNQKYQLEVVEADALENTEITTALLLATDDAHMMKVAKLPQFTNVPVININSDSDELRAACIANLFHVTPSEQMRADALAQWTERNPDTPANIQSWHEDFVKFAASQLNNRFKEGQGVAMEDDGWAGWAAAKMVADTVVQTTQADAAFMLNHLKNDLVFDGQKGENTNYRENGQLRQILLVVDENNEILAEAPLRGAGGLDSLGHTTCK